MKFTTGIWRRIALVASALNFAGAGFAIAGRESWHAAVHVALGLGFAWWAQWLGQRHHAEIKTEIEDTLANPIERLQELEGDMERVQRELTEVQERLDFAERLLVQSRESRQNP